MNVEDKLTCDDVAEKLRQGVRNEVSVECLSPCSWRETHAGDVDFAFGDWTITFFNDCDDLDYVDNAVAPDGRSGEYDDWADTEGGCPLGRLSADEFAALFQLLISAPGRRAATA